MSSPELTRRVALRSAALGALALALAGCFRPLYGPTASGVPLQDVLAAIEVLPITAPQGQERVTHYLRSELVFDLDGSGEPRTKKYKLSIAVAERVETPVVNTATGRAESATLVVTANYKLTRPDGATVIDTEKATGSASYDRDAQRFATVRAARDADIRVAKLLAEQIKTRLALRLANMT